MEELNIAQTEKETQYPQLPPFNNSSALSLQLGASGPANVDGDADGSKSSSTDPDQHVQNAHALDDQNIDQGGKREQYCRFGYNLEVLPTPTK